jgi:serine/threonine protein kinase
LFLKYRQELLTGNSLEHQLYTERWKPNQLQTLKVALDIAQGMHYLHTAFEKKLRGGGGSAQDDDACTQAIIHRDLKSPNLLLSEAPVLGSQGVDWLHVKITDFGLSADKSLDEAKQTALMTGCGSVLWMAPEMMSGQMFNESVDVFSYAMCLLEVVDCQLPWTGCGAPGSVPLKIARGERPEAQLDRAAAQPAVAELIRQCWAAEPADRPSFAGIVVDLRRWFRQANHDQQTYGTTNVTSATSVTDA